MRKQSWLEYDGPDFVANAALFGLTVSGCQVWVEGDDLAWQSPSEEAYEALDRELDVFGWLVYAMLGLRGLEVN
jgi:hypothetical protein